MHNTIKIIIIIIFLISFSGLILLVSKTEANSKPGAPSIHNVNLIIHLRGVYETKISLMTQTGETKLIQSILTRESVKNGETTTLSVPEEYLPGEFVIRFDYKENMTSTPYPSEKSLIINQQDIELWVHPIFSNNPDSTWYQKDELENTVLAKFMSENTRQKEMLGLLQNFLISYDDNKSEFYREGIKEYEKRRNALNEWINGQIKEYRDFFVATIFRFELVPEINWNGDESARKQSLREHYFDQIDFKDTLLANTSEFKSWMDQYVNLYGEQATTVELRDSLFTLAGKRAIEKAKEGHPKIYGWMVDYFFRGYESFNIQKGIAMLAPYLDDPNCLTSKRQAIQKRLNGIKTLVPGTVAPDFSFTDDMGNEKKFQDFNSGTAYKLVLFWSADCPHCDELVNKLIQWYQQQGNQKKLYIFAISLDETDTEIKAWQDYKTRLPGWKHILAKGGVNSPEADSYFILATPVMVLVDSATNTIISLPETVEQLQAVIK